MLQPSSSWIEVENPHLGERQAAPELLPVQRASPLMHGLDRTKRLSITLNGIAATFDVCSMSDFCMN